MRLSIVLVHHHTPRLAERAVAALRREISSTLAGAEILIVDNGSDAQGREILAGLPARLLEPGTNLGYAGGANLGVREAAGDRLILMNPDVLVEPGCLAGLIETLEAGAAVAGPRFFLDSGLRMMIPPSEERTRRSELLRTLGGRGRTWALRARRRWRHHARRHWRAETAIESFSLSGALLAFRRSAWDQAGSFDERYRLYFEEDDWLRRVRSCGLAGRYVPRAKAVHLYNRSAGAEPRARGWFEESRRRFEEQYLGRWFGGLIRILEPASAQAPTGEDRAEDLSNPIFDLSSLTDDRAEKGLWVELSESPLGVPAVSERLAPGLTGVWELPAEVRARLTPGRYSLRVVSDEGEEIAVYEWTGAGDE